MKIVIIGGGRVGYTLAEQLLSEGHSITLIDSNSSALSRAGSEMDILCIEGNGATAGVQLEAGVDTADLLIAATDSDELNLLCCLVAKKLGAKHSIPRVRIPEYDRELSLIADSLGLSLSVNPELVCASEMARSLKLASAAKVDTFAGGKIDLIHIPLSNDCKLVGRALTELPSITGAKTLICAVERADGQVCIPDGSFRLEAGDRISIISEGRNVRSLFKKCGLAVSPIKQVMLIGGSSTAYYLASQLTDAGIGVTMIERNMLRCEELSELLPKATILCGDGTNEGFLRENGLEEADAFVALTDIDEANLLVSMYVRRAFPSIKVLVKNDIPSYDGLVESMDIGSIFNERTCAANMICSYVRSMDRTVSKVETLYKLVGGKVEALEFRVSDNADFRCVPLHRLKLRKNVLIASILRKGRLIIPNGNDTLESGDSVIVVTTVTGLNDLQDIMDKRK